MKAIEGWPIAGISECEAELSGFLHLLAQHASEHDCEKMADCYHLPSIFVDEDDKRVCYSREEIATHVASYLVHQAAGNAGTYIPNLTQVMPLSKDTFFVQVSWIWLDEAHHPARGRLSSFTIQRGGRYGFEIVVAVNDEEQVKDEMQQRKQA